LVGGEEIRADHSLAMSDVWNCHGSLVSAYRLPIMWSCQWCTFANGGFTVVIDVINRDGNLSKGVDHDASFYGVQLCGWMLMDFLFASKGKKQRRDISATALCEKKKPNVRLVTS
jgi:hypothetical protein